MGSLDFWEEVFDFRLPVAADMMTVKEGLSLWLRDDPRWSRNGSTVVGGDGSFFSSLDATMIGLWKRLSVRPYYLGKRTRSHHDGEFALRDTHHHP